MTQANSVWQAPLARETQIYLAGLLDLNPAIPASSIPAQLTILPGPPTAAPPDDAARIAASVAGRMGLVAVTLAGRDHPIWLRAGTGDEAAALPLVPKIPHHPRRILEIGAGAGYRSVALALAYPGAEILAIEPDAAHRRVNLLNTLPYGHIRSHFLTIGVDNARYSAGLNGHEGRMRLAPDRTGMISATPLDEFLREQDWELPDTVIITPDAASAKLLRRPWPRSVRLIAIATGGHGSRASLAAPFAANDFTAMPERDYLLLHRAHAPTAPVAARPDHILRPDGPLRRLVQESAIAEAAGCHPLGANGFRLVVNAPGTPPARLRVSHECRAGSALHVQLRLPQHAAPAVRFTILVTGAPGAPPICELTATLCGGEISAISTEFPTYSGPCEISFTAELAPPGIYVGPVQADITAAFFI